MKLNRSCVIYFYREISAWLCLLQIRIVIIVVVNGYGPGYNPWRNKTADDYA
jgi:hypothetical protein